MYACSPFHVFCTSLHGEIAILLTSWLFDILQVSIRAFLPVWLFLYVLQFLLMPLIARDYWVSNFFGNTMYLLALSYYFVITFLGYNGTFHQQPASPCSQLIANIGCLLQRCRF